VRERLAFFGRQSWPRHARCAASGS
jgi:hypothetical protein